MYDNFKTVPIFTFTNILIFSYILTFKILNVQHFLKFSFFFYFQISFTFHFHLDI